MLTGQVDSTFTTQQRDLFTSGLLAEIGVNAFAVWSVIKYYADYQTGKAYPGMREIGRKIGLSKDSVSRAIPILINAHLLRVVEDSKYKKRGQTYVARERITVRLGDRVLCVVVFDYVPNELRKKIRRINETLKTGENDFEAWSEVEIIPGDGFVWDANSKSLKAKILEAEIVKNNIDGNDYHRQVGEKILSQIAPGLAKKIMIKNEASSQTRDSTMSQ